MMLMVFLRTKTDFIKFLIDSDEMDRFRHNTVFLMCSTVKWSEFH